MTEIKLALRQFLKNPGFSGIAVITLALAIGANTAIFGIVHAVLLKRLPYPDPDRLVTLWERSPERGVEQELVSGPNYLDWRRFNTVFSQLSVNPGWEGSEVFNLVLPSQTLKIRASYTSASLFATLGTQPLLGRTLLPEEDEKEGNRAAVLSYGLWQRQFGGNSNTIGQTLTLDSYGRRDYTIVGVMPPGFGTPGSCELWLPLGWMGVTLDERRSAHWHTVIGRLKRGVTLVQAASELSAIQRRLKQTYPGETIGSEVSIVPLLDQAVGRNMRRALMVLWGVVAGVLLIACANVANLMLARAVSREKEIALRVALGASRWRLVRQLLTESVVLSLAGGALGVFLGWWGLRAFMAFNPSNLPRLNEATLDPAALAFTAGLSVLTGVLFGLVPAWQLWKSEVNQALKEGAPALGSSSRSSRMRSLLIVSEVALSTVLLAGAGLMLQSFAGILKADRGFQPEHLLTAELDFSVSGFTTWVRPTATRPQIPLHELIERLRALPGVQAVGAGSRLRRENRPPGEAVALFGRANVRPEELPKAEFSGISPDWARALGIRIVRGRDFTESDTLTAPGAVLINQTMASRYFPNDDPIGKRLKMGGGQPSLDATNVWGLPEWSTIVGVVSDVKSLHPQPQAVAEVYSSYWQWPMQNPTLLIRARGNPSVLADMVRDETKAIIPNLPAPLIRTMDSVLAEAAAQPRLQAALISLFAGLALLLAAVGLYGVLAYTVTQRTREIGIRIALGSRKGKVVSLVLVHGMKLALIGVGLGLALAFALTRILRSLLYGVDPTDPLTFALVSLLMAAVALIACMVPACRAARVNPLEALRYE